MTSQRSLSSFIVQVWSPITVFNKSLSITAGKDRTGVLAALIHRLAGSADEAIVHDFTLTRVGLEPGREALLTMMKSLYGESAWNNPVLLVLWGIHANGMTGFLNILDEKHGGVVGYLKSLGFSGSDIDTMKGNLTLIRN